MASENRRWKDEEVVVLLATLNYNIKEISDEFKRDKQSGINRAATLIKPQLENCNNKRITDKIDRLWDKHGPDGKISQRSDPMYLTGASCHTLPNGYPQNLLDQVNSKVELMQAGTKPPEKINSHGRSTRRGKKDVNDNSVRCRCGSVHLGGAFVCCDHCKSWQHSRCYYKTDYEEDLEDIYHLCDGCISNAHGCLFCQLERTHGKSVETVDSLSSLLSDMKLQSRKMEMSISSREIKPPLQQLQPADSGQFGICDPTNDDAEELWGPEPEKIRKAVSIISKIARRVAHSLIESELVCGYPQANIDQTDLKAVTQVLKYDADSYLVLLQPDSSSQADPVFLLRALISAAIWKWAFGTTENEQDSVIGILLEQYQNILSHQYGTDGLVKLQDTAWRAVVQHCNKRTDKILSREATLHARRLLDMLSTFIGLSEEKSPRLRSVEDWIENTTNGKDRFELLIQAFQVGIKQLRMKMPLSREWYEIYHPEAGESYDSVLMEDEDGNSVKPDATIFLTLSPAVIQYSKETDLGKAHCNVLSAEDYFVRATSAEQRAQGEVICRAVVVLA